MNTKPNGKTIGFVPVGDGVILHEIVNPRRIPDSSINGVILSPARARLLAVTIRRGYAESADELRAFLMGLEREQRAEDKKEPEVASARRLMWHRPAPKVRPAATPAPRLTKTDADRRREVFQAEQEQSKMARSATPAKPRQTKTDADRLSEVFAAEQKQSELEAGVWRPAGAGRMRIRRLNLDPARAAALMGAIADTAKLRERLGAI